MGGGPRGGMGGPHGGMRGPHGGMGGGRWADMVRMAQDHRTDIFSLGGEGITGIMTMDMVDTIPHRAVVVARWLGHSQWSLL